MKLDHLSYISDCDIKNCFLDLFLFNSYIIIYIYITHILDKTSNTQDKKINLHTATYVVLALIYNSCIFNGYFLLYLWLNLFIHCFLINFSDYKIRKNLVLNFFIYIILNKCMLCNKMNICLECWKDKFWNKNKCLLYLTFVIFVNF